MYVLSSVLELTTALPIQLNVWVYILLTCDTHLHYHIIWLGGVRWVYTTGLSIIEVHILSHDSEPVINTSVCARSLHVLSHNSELVYILVCELGVSMY